jgi:hypothetical protein
VFTAVTFAHKIPFAIFVMLSAAVGLAVALTSASALSSIEGGSAPILGDRDRSAATSEASIANPLWGIPLKDLTATRNRPIFSSSRRAVAPAVDAAPFVPPQATKPSESERLPLLLVGTVAGHKASIGIFLDRSANIFLRLKAGEEHKGWMLREVRSHEIVLKNGDRTTTLSLPAPLEPVTPDSEDDSKRPAQ